ncbi:GHKL domain-containing protein [Leuconostoc mesenteroides]|jgi:two-component system sensor histidine kinase AgrC|nr:GHKL domain-containing protein [Leuconostoc mesenteroides]
MFLDSIWLVELTFIFLLIIMIYPLCRYFQQLRTQHEYESRATQTYVTKLEQICSSYRHFQHDYKNILASLALAIDTKNLCEIEEVYHSFLSESTSALPLSPTLNLQLITDLNLRSLLVVKNQYAIDSGLFFKVDIAEKFNMTVTLDLYRTIGILLDNAIEGAINSIERKVILSILSDNDYHIVSITNTINQNVALSNMNKNGFSTKPGHSGIGLTFVEQYMARMPTISMHATLMNQNFTQTLTIGELHNDLSARRRHYTTKAY